MRETIFQRFSRCKFFCFSPVIGYLFGKEARKNLPIMLVDFGSLSHPFVCRMASQAKGGKGLLPE
jgi:hypothetical protein